MQNTHASFATATENAEMKIDAKNIRIMQIWYKQLLWFYSFPLWTCFHCLQQSFANSWPHLLNDFIDFQFTKVTFKTGTHQCIQHFFNEYPLARSALGRVTEWGKCNIMIHSISCVEQAFYRIEQNRINVLLIISNRLL